MKQFNRLSGRSWLQGRYLIPAMTRYAGTSNGRVLDLGCGHSPWRHFFPHAREFLRMDRYAVDAEVKVIDDIYQLPLNDNDVSVIILSRMLGDVPDQSRLLVELARVLEPGGHILVYEAICYPQHDLPHDYWRVMPAGLKWSSELAGLQVEELIYCGGYATQLALQLNTFIIGKIDSFWLTRPIATGLRIATNLTCAAIDWAMPRPHLATDYFASLVKPQA